MSCCKKSSLDFAVMSQRNVGDKIRVWKLLKDEFPDIVLWQCLNHRLELAVGNALNATSGTNDLQSFHESLYFYIVSHRRTCENLVAVSMICIPASKRIGKVFAIRWVGSSFRAVSAVKHSFPALAQHFQNASENETRQSAEKADFQISANGGLLQRLQTLSETPQNRNATLPKTQNLLSIQQL